jgi:hypothetical protein
LSQIELKLLSQLTLREKEKESQEYLEGLYKKIIKLSQQQIIPHLLEKQYCRKKWELSSLV